jgi:hypothetical protein
MYTFSNSFTTKSNLVKQYYVSKKHLVSIKQLYNQYILENVKIQFTNYVIFTSISSHLYFKLKTKPSIDAINIIT